MPCGIEVIGDRDAPTPALAGWRATMEDLRMAGRGVLALVRHGQSTDNELNLFSGWRDPALTPRGIDEARRAGRALRAKGLVFDRAATSLLARTNRTLELILAELGAPALPVTRDVALNERDYGELSGLDKDQARAIWGAQQVRRWRKSYEGVPPGGESLAMTAARTMPFYATTILPHLMRGERVLVVAHGNSLRSIVKHLDALGEDEIETRNIATGEILLYAIGPDGAVAGKQSILAAPA